MRPQIDKPLVRGGGACSREQLLHVVTRNPLDDEIRRGYLVAVFPRAYARPWDADQSAVREAAAVASIGGDAALSHLSALRRWGLPVPASHPVHVTTRERRHPSGRPGELFVHRTRQRRLDLVVDDVRTVPPEWGIVGSWPLLRGSAQRAPAIVAIRNRLVSAEDVTQALDAATRLPGRSQQRQLIERIHAGCHSELELWGYQRVFDVPGLSHARRQLRVRVDGRVHLLDMAYEAELVAVELDGRAYHASPEQWGGTSGVICAWRRSAGRLCACRTTGSSATSRAAVGTCWPYSPRADAGAAAGDRTVCRPAAAPTSTAETHRERVRRTFRGAPASEAHGVPVSGRRGRGRSPE